MQENTNAPGVEHHLTSMWYETTHHSGMMPKCSAPAVSMSGHGKYQNTYEGAEMPVEDDVPEHIQRVRAMDTDELLKECNAIISMNVIEPERTLPDSFKDGKSK